MATTPHPQNEHGHHDHGHTHDHAKESSVHHHASYGKLLTSFWVITLFMAVEIIGGWRFHSLTLMSDGFHMLSDAVSLGLSALAVSLATRKATLVLLSLLIGVQAVNRLIHPIPVEAKAMLWVATLGLMVNLWVAWWLHRGENEKTINEEGAFMHVLADLGASLVAVIAALLILGKGWIWADPVLSLLISVLIAVGGVRVMRRSGHILVEGTPEGVEIEAIRVAILSNSQVRSVHDLHMWTMNGRDLYLSAHIETVPGESTEKTVMTALTHTLTHDFHVNHITLQIGQCVEDDCFNKC
jgi:cobalt-zinc-cadmium efflux system protein